MLGVEISEKQKNIDWEKVKKANIAFAMLCCGYGGEYHLKEDAKFWENVRACEKQGIPYGIYFCSHAENRKQAGMEAAYIRSVLQKQKPEYPVMFRLEACSNTLHLERDSRREFAQIFCEAVQQEGFRPGICANKYWFTNLLTEPEFSRWERWVIQHYKECTYAGAYTIWEFTSDGRVDGIPGSVALLKCSKAYAGRGKNGKAENQLPDLHGYAGTSLAGALNTKGYPSDFEFRRHLAVKTGLVRQSSDYKGTAGQNMELLRMLGGTISVSKMIREGSYIKLKPGSRNINTDMPFEEIVYGNTYQVLAVSGISIIFGIKETVIGKVNRDSVIVT